MRTTTLIVLTQALSVLNSGCDSVPSTAEMSAMSAEEQFNIAEKYVQGDGVFSLDYKQAVKWYRSAAEQGQADAQTILGKFLFDGMVVKQDFKEAYVWFSLAAASGEKHVIAVYQGKWEGVNELDMVKAQLSPDELAEAQSRITELSTQIEERQQ